MLRAQQPGQLDQADVLLRFDGRQDHGAEDLDVVRAHVAALGFGLERALGVGRMHPAYGAGRRDAEALACCTARQAVGNGCNQPGRRSTESGLPIHAGLLPSLQGESHPARVGEAQSTHIDEVML